tara:strand:+ start:493 stop:1011 length:519 start_codon:yes stop_codon:yes gene_type:complete
MKSFKDLRDKISEVLSEHHDGNGMGLQVPNMNAPYASDGGVNMFMVEDPEVLNRLNLALKNVLEYSRGASTNTQMVEIKKALVQCGLDFDTDEITISEAEGGSQELQLKQFGGRTGMTPEEGFVDDDGISHRNDGKGMVIRIEMKVDNGSKDISAVVMPKAMSESFDGGENI